MLRVLLVSLISSLIVTQQSLLRHVNAIALEKLYRLVRVDEH